MTYGNKIRGSQDRIADAQIVIVDGVVEKARGGVKNTVIIVASDGSVSYESILRS